MIGWRDGCAAIHAWDRRRMPCSMLRGHCMMPAVQLAAAETAQLRQLVDAALAEVAALSAQVCRFRVLAGLQRSVCLSLRAIYRPLSLVGRSRQSAAPVSQHSAAPQKATHRPLHRRAACNRQRTARNAPQCNAAHSCDVPQARCNMQITARNVRDAAQSVTAAECTDLTVRRFDAPSLTRKPSTCGA